MQWVTIDPSLACSSFSVGICVKELIWGAALKEEALLHHGPSNGDGQRGTQQLP